MILYNAKAARDLQILEVQEDAWKIVDVVAIRQSRFIDSARQLLMLLAETPQVASGDPYACELLLQRVVERNKVYKNLGVIESNGAVRCRAREVAQPTKVETSAHFRRAVATKAFAIGDYQIERNSIGGSVNFGYPVINADGKVAAVIFAALDVNWMTQLAAESNLPEGVALSIVDSKGTLLARFPEPKDWVGKHIPDAPLFEMLQMRNLVTKELVGVDGLARLYAFKSLGNGTDSGQIHVIVGVPKDVAFGAINRALTRNLVWLTCVCLLATGLAWFVGSKFVVGYVRIRAEAEEVRARLAAIVESSEDAIVGMTLDGAITTWNNGAASMYGYSADEVNGQAITLLIPPERHGEIPELLEIIKRGKGVNRYETERIHKDGRHLYVSASLSPIRDRLGTVIGASTITRDITLLRKNEEQLLAHADQLETLHAVAQEVGGTLSLEEVVQRALNRVVSASHFDFAFVHFSGEVAGGKFYGASSGTHSAAELERVWRGLGDRLTGDFLECRNPWFVEDVAAVAELSAGANQSGIKALAVLPLCRTEQYSAALVVMNTTTRRFTAEESQFLPALSRQIALAIENARLYGATLQANKELQDEVEERRRAEKTLADFTAMVVHDLRSPLSNVVSITESIIDELFGPVTEPQRKWLWKIQTNCKSLIGHVSDFLDLSKIDAGQLEIRKEPVELEPLIHESLVEYSIEADKRNILLKTEIGARIPTVLADPRRVNQVLSNLLSNALKFTEEGGKIDVGASRGDHDEVLVWVKDSGIGIHQDEVEQLFGMYRQLSSGTRSKRKGTGLGLAICKNIVEAQGGRIWVESKQGKGTTFFFSLSVNAENS